MGCLFVVGVLLCWCVCYCWCCFGNDCFVFVRVFVVFGFVSVPYVCCMFRVVSVLC